jgi:tryptophan-rich sensory protein
MKKTIQFIGSILLCLGIGALSGIATSSGVKTWYIDIIKPVFNPPNYVFAPVWTVLYFLMGVSFYLILQGPKSVEKSKAIRLFLLQLTLNFAWSFLFFKFHLIGIAFIEIILIWLAVLAMILQFYKVNRLAAKLQIPYLLWLSFATVLNASIWWLN